MTAADFIILGTILLSGVFAMTRGLTREVFSIASWALAALITYFLYPPLEGLGVAIFSFAPTIVGQIATGVIIFSFLLLSFSFVTMKLTEKLRGKDAGKVDGTAGFLFGLVRGYILVCLVFLMLTWFWVPAEEPDWIANSAFRPAIDKTNEAFLSLISKAESQIPEDILPPGPNSQGDGDDIGKLIESNS